MRKGTLAISWPQIPWGDKPDWFQSHGGKMRIEVFDIKKKRLVLAGSAAWLSIYRLRRRDPDGRWLIRWGITHSPTNEVRGRLVMDDMLMIMAFNLRNCKVLFRPSLHHTLPQIQDADTAVASRFIRKGPFLNIPCPGTGYAGDPNVSVLIRDDMREAVRQLLAA